MTTKHHLTHADEVYVGGGYFAPMFANNGRKGAPIDFLTKFSLGSPVALDADGLVQAATSTELPNNETVTYTTLDDGTSPFDNAATPAPASVVMADGSTQSVWTLDVPRNVTLAVTHASSVVAMSCTVTGYDEWGQLMVETLSVTATGTSKTDDGAKAFKYIKSYAFTSAGNAESNTANVGWGDVLGLPYKLADKSDCVRVFFNGAVDDSATVVAAVTDTATATTGDVRGTVDPNSACDGSAVYVWMHVADVGSETGLRGVDQYGG